MLIAALVRAVGALREHSSREDMTAIAAEGIGRPWPARRSAAGATRRRCCATTCRNVDGWCSCRVGFGDGYLTAALGVVAGRPRRRRVRPRRGPADRDGRRRASLVALGVAAYNALGDWNAYVWTELQNLEVTKAPCSRRCYA